MFLMFLDYFDVLISKIIFKNKKNIILIYFKIKNIFKNNYYHTLEHSRRYIFASLATSIQSKTHYFKPVLYNFQRMTSLRDHVNHLQNTLD
jgi:hypothetical protein